MFTLVNLAVAAVLLALAFGAGLLVGRKHPDIANAVASGANQAQAAANVVVADAKKL